MAKVMPPLRAEFSARVSDAINLAAAGEIARSEAPVGSRTRAVLHHARLEYLYEIAYLRIFVGWENFLEQVFLRYLCGYSSSVGLATPALGKSFSPTLAKAEQAVLAGQAFRLWHNPATVVHRSQQHFSSCPLETVINSNLSRIEQLAAVRHRITHGQPDARRKFDAATMQIAGRRYRGARAGAFLRDDDITRAPSPRWLSALGNEFQALASQIA